MQTYKIYINESCLIITDDQPELTEGAMSLRYHKKTKLFFQIIDRMEKSTPFTSQDIILIAQDPKQAFADFRNLYYPEKAAGGLIYNPLGEGLFIFRRGYWDLPKGKMDPGEVALDTAYREITEEVGLSSIEAMNKIGHTWHTYFHKKHGRVLKKTVWYDFKVIKKEAIRLQAEEDIEAFHWIAPELFLKSTLPTYRSIKDLIHSIVARGE